MFGSVPQDVFLFDPRRAGFLMGERGRLYDMTAGNVLSFSFVIALCTIMSVVFLVNGLQERAIRAQLDQAGVTTDARIVSHRTSTSTDSKGRRSTTYYITYEFAVEQRGDTTGKTVTHEESVNRDLYNLRNESIVQVRYLPDDANVVRLLGNNRNTEFMIIVGIGILAIPVIVVVIALWIIRRSRRLINDGQVIMGKVTKAEGRKIKGGYQVRISYQFLSPLGSELTREESRIRNDLRNAALPNLGANIAVLYVDDKLYRML